MVSMYSLATAARQLARLLTIRCALKSKDANVPVAQALEEHKKLVKQTYPMQAWLELGTAAWPSTPGCRCSLHGRAAGYFPEPPSLKPSCSAH